MSQLFELIDLTKNMGMPAIWSSEKGAEGFIWGGLFIGFPSESQNGWDRGYGDV